MKTLLGCGGLLVLLICIVLFAMALPRVPDQLALLYAEEAKNVQARAEAKLITAMRLESPEGIEQLNDDWYAHEKLNAEVKKIGIMGGVIVLPFLAAVAAAYVIVYRPLKHDADDVMAKHNHARISCDNEKIVTKSAWDAVQRLADFPGDQPTRKVIPITGGFHSDWPTRPDNLPM